MLLVESWKPTPGYEGFYEVSDLGSVRSVDRTIITSDGQHQFFRGRQLSGYSTCLGYRKVKLATGQRGTRREVFVHRLVGLAFLPNPNGAPYINHIDNNPGNNSADNLEWCTQQENLAHARKQGRMPDNYWKGRRSPAAILDDSTVAEIRAAYAGGGWSWERLGLKYGVSKRAIGRLIKRETYADV